MQQGYPHPPVPFPGPQKIQPHVLNRRGGGRQLGGEVYIRRLLTLPTKGTFYTQNLMAPVGVQRAPLPAAPVEAGERGNKG